METFENLTETEIATAIEYEDCYDCDGSGDMMFCDENGNVIDEVHVCARCSGLGFEIKAAR